MMGWPPNFHTPLTPLSAEIVSFLQFWRNPMVSINAVNREVFDKQTTRIFPSWTSSFGLNKPPLCDALSKVVSKTDRRKQNLRVELR